MSSDRFHLVMSPGDRFEAGAVARAIGPIIRRPLPDISLALRYGGGWIARHVPEELLEPLETRLREEFDLRPLRIPDDVSPERPPVARVKSVVFDEERLHLTAPFGEETVELRDLAAIDVTFFGVSTSDDAVDEPTELESLASAVSRYARHREMIHDPRWNLRAGGIHLFTAEPIEVYQIELGTLMPELALEGEWNNLDNWFHLLTHLVEYAPPTVLLPEVTRFLADADRDAVWVEKREEFDHRLTWLSELIARGLWGPTATPNDDAPSKGSE